MVSPNKRLLLILPRSERGYWGKVSRGGKAGFVRLGLPTIAAMTPPDWDVEILDTRVTPVDFNKRVDLVGITAFTAEIPSAYEIADGFKRRGVKVIIGGVHASAMPEEALGHADSVVVGEAELVWKDVLEDFNNGGLKPIYRSNRLIDMTAMPVARRDLLDRKMYVSGFNTIQATRGCPFDCEFCAVTAFFGKRFRTRPVMEVIEEIKGFDTREFFFLDDNIAGHPGYAKGLFKALIPLKRTWGGQTSITIARDEELLSLYARSGGRYAFIGLESLSRKNLEGMNKGWNSPSGYKESIKRIHKAGINIVGSFIFGLDEDEPSVFKDTLDFIMENKIDAAQFHILTPFPGTRLYETFEREGRITDRDWARYHTGEVVFKPKGMSPEELQQGYFWIYRNTYTPWNILQRSLRGLRGISYRMAVNLSYRRKALRMPV
ncbi:MAG: B12-binding domain-containing radical SAM protein [Deltaproteobacteria bacterium]|nr:B12-binding domain-containing radical SAM protein [Deltaproteobacteria bacterium]